MIEHFCTPAAFAGPFEIKEKGSRFIAYVSPAASAADAEIFVQQLKKQFYDSTHVCWGYRLGKGQEQQFRYSDDGEPSGTAGLPIYQELVRAELFDVACAVVRYYGGVKLGTGGLARAYGGVARQLIEILPVTVVEIRQLLHIDFPFEHTGIVMHLCSTVAGVTIAGQTYTETGISMTVSIPVAKVADFQALLIEKSAGRLQARVVE